MIHEDFEGNVREVRWGELQEWSNRFANVLRAHGVEKGDRVAMLLPPTPETAAAFFGTFKAGAILLSMSVLYGDEGIRHRVNDSEPKVLVTERGERRPRRRPSRSCILDDDLLASGDPRVRAPSTPPPTTPRSSTTPPAPPGSPRASCTPTATCSRTRSSSTATRCRRASCFHGMGEWAWAAGHRAAARAVAPRRRAGRLPARGRLRPAQAARLPRRATASPTSSRRRRRCAR